MNKFTSALIDPLKADADTRNTFQSCFDYVVDKAIDKEQKEVPEKQRDFIRILN